MTATPVVGDQPMPSRRNILVSSAGRRVSLIRDCQHDLRSLFPEAAVVATDLQPELSSACQVADVSAALPHVGSAHYLDALESVCSEYEVALILPTIDTELPVLANAAQRLRAGGVDVSVPDSAIVDAANDKRLTPGLLADFDLPCPAEMSPASLRYPAFVKPRDGSSSTDAMLLRSAADLIAEHMSSPRFMFQEYMDPAEFDEVTVDLYYDRSGSLRCLVPRLRLATRAGEVAKGRTIRDGLYDHLLTRFGSWPGARGCVTLQVFANHDRSRVFGIEVNPRFGGGYPLSYAAGARFPEWLFREYLLGEAIPFYDGWRADLLMLRYDDAVYLDAAAGR